MTFFQRNIKKIILLVATALLVCTTLFISYKGAKIDLLFSDAISDNNILQGPFIPGDINIQAIHTHLIKWPIAILENTIGLTFHVHFVMVLLLLLAMNLWLGYLFYRFSNKNTIITSISIVLLAGVELMGGINANEGTLSMIQNRNIEIPMVIALVIFLFNQKRTLSVKLALATILLSIIFVSDQLILYATVLGTVLYAIWTFISNKQRSIKALPNRPLYASIIVAAVLSKVITVGFGLLGLANFYNRENDNLLYAKSVTGLFNNILAYAGKIMDVFGADFLNQKIINGPLFALNLLTLGLSVYLIVRFVRKKKQEKSLDNHQRTIAFLLASYFFAMLLFTVIIPRELAGRYFAFMPAVGILLFSYTFKSFSPTFDKRKTLYTIGIIVAACIFFLLMARGAGSMFFNQQFNSLSAKIGDSTALVKDLTSNDVTVYVDQDYWRNHIIKQHYDEMTGQKLAIPSVYCGSNVVDKQFSKESWAKPNGSRVAFRVKECSGEGVIAEFGQPDKIIYLSDDKKDALYIYDHDVRDKFDLKEYAKGYVKP